MVQWKYVGQQYLDNTQSDVRTLDAYQYTNLHINYNLPLKKNTEVFIGFSLQNITNSLYSASGYTYAYVAQNTTNSSNYYFPQAGRYFMLRLGLKL